MTKINLTQKKLKASRMVLLDQAKRTKKNSNTNYFEAQKNRKVKCNC